MGSINGDCGWFDFGAYLRSKRVKAMSWDSQGCYFALLCHGWLNGGIPARASELRALLGLTSGTFRRIWSQVGQMWHDKPGGPGILINERQERERVELLAFRKSEAERQRRRRMSRGRDGSCHADAEVDVTRTGT